MGMPGRILGRLLTMANMHHLIGLIGLMLSMKACLRSGILPSRSLLLFSLNLLLPL